MEDIIFPIYTRVKDILQDFGRFQDELARQSHIIEKLELELENILRVIEKLELELGNILRDPSS